MLEGNKYNSNLYAITDFKKTRGNKVISNIDKVINILFKFLLKLNF